VEVEADDEEQAAQEFLQIVSQYLGGIYTNRPFNVKRISRRLFWKE
jgi:hypothetical protein